MNLMQYRPRVWGTYCTPQPTSCWTTAACWTPCPPCCRRCRPRCSYRARRIPRTRPATPPTRTITTLWPAPRPTLREDSPAPTTTPTLCTNRSLFPRQWPDGTITWQLSRPQPLTWINRMLMILRISWSTSLTNNLPTAPTSLKISTYNNSRRLILSFSNRQ